MDEKIFSASQIDFFSNTLHQAFLRYGFETIEEPYIDTSLLGFRATYIRRYVGYKPMPIEDKWLTILIQVVGLPFGCNKQKMVVLSSARTITYEPFGEALKLRVHFDDLGNPFIVYGDHKSNKAKQTCNSEAEQTSCISTPNRIDFDLGRYISHLIQTISPGLILLPIEMKLEILKRLSVESIIRMSQVNSDFHQLIFHQGEGLWKYLCLRDFNVRKINRRMYKNWKELYKDLYIEHQIDLCRKERALTAAPELLALPPVPGRLQIEWPLHPLAIPLYPFPDPLHPIALDFIQRRRSDSVGSLS